MLLKCLAAWKSNSTNLNKISLTPISLLAFPSVNYTLSLYLPANSLLAGNGYIFSLSCDRFSTSIHVIMNSPPSNGNFTIIPHSGKEMTESFQFISVNWYDVDLPISYQFGFNDYGTNSVLYINDKSLYGAVSSSLPAGRHDNGFQVKCVVQIYDSLGCGMNADYSVIVSPLTSVESSTAISNAVSQLSSENITSSQITNTISIVGSILNSVNCSIALICGSLNRQNCSSVPHSCGPCLQGFIGESGSHTSLCFSSNVDWIASSGIRTTLNGNCQSDLNCSAPQVCDKLGKCVFPPKSCPNDCSQNGNCTFFNSFTGIRISDCSLFSPDCVATCECINGYGGGDCKLSEAQLSERRLLRHQLLLHLSTIAAASTNKSSLSVDTVQAWASSLSCLTQNPNELSQRSTKVSLEVANNILSSALSINLPYESLSTVLDAINSVSQASQQQSSGKSIKALLGLYNTVTLRGMVEGQGSVNNVQDSFRTTVNILNPNSITNVTI